MLQEMRPLNSVLRNQSEVHDLLLTFPNWGCKSNPGSGQRHNSEVLVEFPWRVRVIAKRALKKRKVVVVVVVQVQSEPQNS